MDVEARSHARVLRWSWTLVLALVFVGCAASTQHAAPPTTATAADYAPLTVGSSWTYDIVFPLPGEATVTMVGQKDGFWVDDHDGAYRLTPDGLRDRAHYLIRHPIAVGTTWKAVLGPSAVEHAEITSVGASCTAAAGHFDDCLVVHAWIRRDESMTLHVEWTWARGVGLVKIETAAEIKGQGRQPQTKQSLKRYVLAEAATGRPAEKAEASDRWGGE